MLPLKKSLCKLCGGGLCEHQKRRSRCNECKGGQIYEHNRIRYGCIDCNGSSVCEHKNFVVDAKILRVVKYVKHNKEKMQM